MPSIYQRFLNWLKGESDHPYHGPVEQTATKVEDTLSNLQETPPSVVAVVPDEELVLLDFGEENASEGNRD